MLAATLITYTGRSGSRSGRRNVMSVSGPRSGPELGRLVVGSGLVGSRRMAVADGRDPDLARLDLLRLRDLEAQDAVLERGLGLVRLEPVRQRHGAAEVA